VNAKQKLEHHVDKEGKKKGGKEKEDSFDSIEIYMETYKSQNEFMNAGSKKKQSIFLSLYQTSKLTSIRGEKSTNDPI